MAVIAAMEPSAMLALIAHKAPGSVVSHLPTLLALKKVGELLETVLAKMTCLATVSALHHTGLLFETLGVSVTLSTAMAATTSGTNEAL